MLKPSLRGSLAFALVSLGLSLAACTKRPAPATEASAAASTAASSAPAPVAAAAKGVNLAIWSGYLQPEDLAEFEKRYGAKVHVSNYSSNEELLAKLQAGASGYDVIVPSDYMIVALAALKLVRDLDYAKLGNSKSLDPRYLKKPYDPTNRVSVPYSWGTTGIAVNHDLYKGTIKGWKDLFTKADLAGKFTLLDDVRETLGAALKAQGFSLNSKDPAQLAKAKALLMGARSRVKAFNSETKSALVNGEMAVAHVYMTDALQARRQSGADIEYVLPEEGYTLWIDNLAIPASAPHPEEAHALINYLLEARVNAATVSRILVAPANKDAFALLARDIQSNPFIFPSDAMLAKSEMIQDLGADLATWDRIWTEVKAGQ